MNEEQRVLRRYPGVPADPVAAMQLARDALDYTTAYQSKELEFSTAATRTYVAELDSILRHLDALANTLSMQVKHRAELADIHTEPGTRLAAAAGYLAELRDQVADRHHATARCLYELGRAEGDGMVRHADPAEDTDEEAPS